MNWSHPLFKKENKKIGDFIFIFLIHILIFILFFDVINSGHTLYGSDFILQFLPWKKFIYDSVREYGSIPFWNPYLFSGIPFISNIQASIFYPLGFLYYLIPPETAYLFSTMLHFSLGSIFTYIFIRSIAVGCLGAFISSIIFIFNGFFIGHLYAGHLTFIQTYIWIPLILLFLKKFFNTLFFKYAIFSGIFWGIQILGGFPQIVFYTILTIFAYFIFNLFYEIRKRSYKIIVIYGIGIIVILCIGFGISAIQVLPTLEFLSHSTRAGGVSYEFATYDSLHPKEMIEFLIPDIFGSVIDNTYWLYKEKWHFWETCAYTGIIPLFLIIFGVKDSKFSKIKSFFVILMIGSILLSFGKFNPIYKVIYRLPGFHNFRIPAQILYLYVFSIAVIAGIIIDQIRDIKISSSIFFFIFLIETILILLYLALFFYPKDFLFLLFNIFSRRAFDINIYRLYERVIFSIDKMLFILLSFLVVLFLFKIYKIRASLFSFIISGIIVIDIILFSKPFIKPYTYDQNHTKKEITMKLSKVPSEGRVAVISKIFNPNDGLLYGFPSIHGYNPLLLKRYVKYYLISQNIPLNDEIIVISGLNDIGSKLFKMLNVKQIVFGQHIKNISNNIPYAYIAKEAKILSKDMILPYMTNRGFDPFKVVLLEGNKNIIKCAFNKNNKDDYSIRIIRYLPDEIYLKVQTPIGGFLVLSEIYYPGWYAEIDKKKVKVLRGNYLFRVIPITKGEHDISLFFISWPFRIGLIISIITVLICIFIILKLKRY